MSKCLRPTENLGRDEVLDSPKARLGKPIPSDLWILNNCGWLVIVVIWKQLFNCPKVANSSCWRHSESVGSIADLQVKYPMMHFKASTSNALSQHTWGILAKSISASWFRASFQGDPTVAPSSNGSAISWKMLKVHNYTMFWIAHRATSSCRLWTSAIPPRCSRTLGEQSFNYRTLGGQMLCSAFRLLHKLLP